MSDLIGANVVNSVAQYVVCAVPIAAAGLLAIGILLTNRIRSRITRAQVCR